MASPGGSFWQFLSSLSPFESWRKYLVFRHKRDQDHRYREAAESRRLELENESRELAILEKRAKIAKQLGATNEELQPLCERVLGRRASNPRVVIARQLGDDEQRFLADGAMDADS
jgi:hypothetical protein